MTKQLLKQKIDHLDAELLLAHALGKTREFILAHPEYKPNIFQRIKYKCYINKREKGIPLAYITGKKEFFNLDFLVNKHTLIPRPETELMVELTIKEIKNKDCILIDIGTGSGCIPISILKNINKNIPTFATDISSKAIRMAKKNAKRHKVDIKFLKGNLLEPMIEKMPNKHLVITANLPYLTEEQYKKESSIQHEPKSALVASQQGLGLYEELLRQIKELKNSFSLFLEIDPDQTTQITELIKKHLPDKSIEVQKDLARRDRVVVVKSPI